MLEVNGIDITSVEDVNSFLLELVMGGELTDFVIEAAKLHLGIGDDTLFYFNKEAEVKVVNHNKEDYEEVKGKVDKILDLLQSGVVVPSKQLDTITTPSKSQPVEEQPEVKTLKKKKKSKKKDTSSKGSSDSLLSMLGDMSGFGM